MGDPLDALYASLPSMQCLGRCQDACGSVAMSRVEQQRIADRHGQALPLAAAFGKGHCPALGEVWGTCTVYPDRPMVCRLWGLVESMQCPWGCVPEGGWLPEARGHGLMAAVRALDEEADRG